MVSLQLRLCLTFLPAAASLRLRDLGRRLCLLFDLCLCPLVAEKASGECVFCAPGDEAILTTGFGVLLWPSVCLVLTRAWSFWIWFGLVVVWL